ncbi:MAG: ECF transporter S component [Planctomycetota bacterium]
MKWFVVLLLAGVVASLTMVIRIPIPGTQGYLNLGDMAVVFSGLFLGKKYGAIAGGAGSAAADMIGGFFIFAPVTLLAKGLEGFIAGSLGRKHGGWVGLAVGAMVFVYFVAEIFLPGMGLAAAVSELPFNAVQAVVGAVGGIAVHRGVQLAFPQPEAK